MNFPRTRWWPAVFQCSDWTLTGRAYLLRARPGPDQSTHRREAIMAPGCCKDSREGSESGVLSMGAGSPGGSREGAVAPNARLIPLLGECLGGLPVGVLGIRAWPASGPVRHVIKHNGHRIVGFSVGLRPPGWHKQCDAPQVKVASRTHIQRRAFGILCCSFLLHDRFRA